MLRNTAGDQINKWGDKLLSLLSMLVVLCPGPRLDEIRESIKILQQAVEQIPEGEIQTGKPRYQMKVPAGEAYGRVEGPKGELGFYLVSDGKGNPYRYHVRAPSFINLTAFGPMCKGLKVADVVAVLGSIDIVLGETDR